MRKIWMLGLLVLSLTLVLVGCRTQTIEEFEVNEETNKVTTETTTETTKDTTTETIETTEVTTEATQEVEEDVVDEENAGDTPLTDEELNAMFRQFRTPEAGDILATMTTDFGDITILLFPEIAPKAVENFTTHAKEGYYDGLTFHRVMNDFMIQGGDPLGTGTGGESIWGSPFEDEFSPFYFPFRGSLCMANSGTNTNGSQFFIVQLGNPADNIIDALVKNKYPSAMVEAYKEHGGTDWLYGKHTVFGQVTSGMDVVDAIAATPTASANKPVEDVIIESIVVSEIN